MNVGFIKKRGKVAHFFNILYGLEKKNRLDKVRLYSDNSLRFPANMVEVGPWLPDDTIVIRASFSGLYGVSSVLPPFMNGLILSDNRIGDSCRAMLGIFQHRLYWLQYQVWKAGYAPFFNDPTSGYTKLLKAIAGNPSSTMAFDKRCSGLISKKPITAHHLTKVCTIIMGFHTTVSENQLTWSYRGRSNRPQLGHNACLGNRYLQATRLFSVTVDCRSVSNMLELYQNNVSWKKLKAMVKTCADPDLRCHFFIQASQGLTAPLLGQDNIGLGLGSILGNLACPVSVRVIVPAY